MGHPILYGFSRELGGRVFRFDGPVESGSADSATSFDPVAIFDTVGPSVVAIATSSGGGTGFFIDDLGHVVTNYHVIQGFDQVLVADAGGNTAPGQVLGFDRETEAAEYVNVCGTNRIPVWRQLQLFVPQTGFK